MKHNKPSTISKILYHSLELFNFSEKAFYRLLNNPKRNTNVISTARFKKKLNVEKVEIDGFNLLTMRTAEATNKHIIFLHGGAYVAEAVKGHRYLIEKLALPNAFKVSFIDYPLAPENRFTSTLVLRAKAYREIIHSYPRDTIFLLGDSAGGGLALAFTSAAFAEKQRYRNASKKQPCCLHGLIFRCQILKLTITLILMYF